MQPTEKGRHSGWAWVLASLLMLAKGSDDRRAVKGGKVEMRATGSRGEAATGGETEANRVVPVKDSILADSDTERPLGDTLSSVVPGVPPKEFMGFTGGIEVVGVKIDTVVDVLADTLRQLAADTLTAIGWRPAPAFNIYPNPVSRGGTLQLAWKTEPGSYQITFMDSRGRLLAAKMLDVAGTGQVDSWEIPDRLAAGIYILRVIRAGGVAGSGEAGVMCTSEVMVR